MALSGVTFGTSGARGRVEAMTDRICYTYTRGYLQYLKAQGELQAGMSVALAGDLRASTPRIMTAVAHAIVDADCVPLNCGFVPTPALALFGIRRAIPSLMVTGSHIPDDRNGIKFYRTGGEILKADEAGIREQVVSVNAAMFDDQGRRILPFALPSEDRSAYRCYLDRYVDFFPRRCLAGRRIGVYEHSSVTREVLKDILVTLGADLVSLGRTDRFVPVDTEAVREQDVTMARRWAVTHRLDALVSTDGDGDRPLVSDEHGTWMRGDVAGVLCARYLGVKHLVTPVSSNTLVDKCGWFDSVTRTRIGSPYVVQAMNQLLGDGADSVAGYEANGGFLTGDSLIRDGSSLLPLPTRDGVIVLLAVLMSAVIGRQTVSSLLAELPPRFTASGRLQAFPTELSRQCMARLNSGDQERDAAAVKALFGKVCGGVSFLDRTDGLRITFDNEEIVHLRPSGNAPELRCYNEANSPERAMQLNRICLNILEGWRD
ncbi:MAG: phosphomannomutase [Gammaproteobacteria bacterium]|nr:phosphomannomutase [Gammaproteobacteria bacterium]